MKKFYFLMVAMLVSLAANAQLYVVGSGDGLGWDPTNPMEVQKGTDGLYTFTINNCTQVQLSTTKAGWDDGWKTAAKKVSGTVQAGDNTLIDGDGDIKMPYTGDWTFKINWENNSLNLSTTSEAAPVELYIRGGMNEWGTADAWKFATTDHVNFTLGTAASPVTIEAGKEFKIGDSNWSKSFGLYNGSITFNQNVTLDITTDGGNMSLAESFTGIITFNLDTKVAYFNTNYTQGGGEVSEGKDLYIVGANYGSWSVDPAYKMTREGNVYTYTFENGISGEWKIWDGSWNYSFGRGGEDDEPGIDKTVDVWFNSNTNFTYNTTDKVTVTLTVVEGSDVQDSGIASKLTIEAAQGGGEEGGEPGEVTEGKDLYIVGQNYGGWNKDESYKMTRNGNVYTYTFADGIDGSWKIFDGTWDYGFGAGEAQPEPGKTVDVWFNSSANFNVKVNGSVTVTLTLVEGSDVENSGISSTLKMEGGQIEEVEVSTDLYLVGELNGWTGKDESLKFDKDPLTGWYTLCLDNGLNGEFLIYNGDYEQVKLGVVNTNTPLSLGENPLIPQGNNMKYTSTEGHGVKLTVIKGEPFKESGANLKIEEYVPTAVETIEAAEGEAQYYNLQGVRVANPENGMFIVVRNGKATKQIVK